MALNWEAPQFFDSDMSCIQQNLEAELVGDFFQCVNAGYSNPHNFLDPWFDPCNLLNLENPDVDHLYPAPSFKPDRFTVEPYPHPKRRKCVKDYHFQDLTPSFSNGFVPNPCPRTDYFPGGFTTPALNFQHAEVVNGITRKTSVENVGKKLEERRISPQSIAARDRRRKITEKTQELGKLVPGGNKMNTVEMLTAAYNYVRFLQAQMGILEFMGSFQEVKAATATELHVVASPIIQEKLYMEQKCLVPKDFVEVLANYFDAQSTTSLSYRTNQLLKSSG
ncbi:transcription factor bHLH52-like [Argentina anserina]|uniref:transcription factor bHLH52-like n=1 Tax=Argentina anserina TaxID=57926 RepID=UPI00217641CB|nr:transcription factor bHLH52-like [Potentilla anserina]